MTVKSKLTRFRAYQLGSPGSSFSYFNGNKFTLIEARLTEMNRKSIDKELRLCGSKKIDTLHITSWDNDHCHSTQLEEIIDLYAPVKIEYPGYKPHTDTGRKSLEVIQNYKAKVNVAAKIVQITPEYISTLDPAASYGYNDVFHHPKLIDETCSNNNSTVKHFRSGSFNVLSLGDVECMNIASGIRRQRTINKEVDVMILAHHGADNGFTTSSFVKTVSPAIAIACTDYANKFDHPRKEVRELLYKNDVALFTTKTGDVIIHSTGNHTGHYKVINLCSDNNKISSEYEFYARKSKLLRNNDDTISATVSRRYNGPKFR